MKITYQKQDLSGATVKAIEGTPAKTITFAADAVPVAPLGVRHVVQVDDADHLIESLTRSADGLTLRVVPIAKTAE